MAEQPQGLRRVLGPVAVTASGVGIIVGAGIYVLLGTAAREAGNAVWLSLVIAAFLCACTGMSYAELASMFSRAGAEYEYTRRVFPSWVAFVVGWMMAVGLMVASAAIAIGFAHYFTYFVDAPIALVAIIVIAGEAVFAAGGIERSSHLTIALTRSKWSRSWR